MSVRFRNNVIAALIVFAFWCISFAAMAADPIVTESTSTVYTNGNQTTKVESPPPSAISPNVGGSASSPVELNSETQTLLQNQITALQNKIVELSVQKRPIAVLGMGRKCGGLDDAKIWINAKCIEFGVGTTSDVWCPKAGFKGLVFAKFTDICARDKFVTKVSTTKPEYEGDKV